MTVRERVSLSLFGHIRASWSALSVILLAFLVTWPLSILATAVLDRRAPVDYIEAYALKQNVTREGRSNPTST